jgi:hypothetical protein
MECAEVRKKLKEYANDEISGKAERAAMEGHISGCPVCKRELHMWQEVMDKQNVVKEMQSSLPKELKDRIKYRMGKSGNPLNAPPVLKKMKGLNNIWNSTLGMVMMAILAVIVPVVVIMILFRAMHPGASMLAPIMVVFGFAVIFIVLIFKSKKRQ